MTKEIICSGFGGQGILTAGLILAHAGNEKGCNVTWYPSYGSEMRGGTANCNIKMSEGEIGNPSCNNLDILIAMNGPAVNKFEHMMRDNGVILVNSDIIDSARKYREGLKVVPVPINTLAHKINSVKSANVIMLGALIKATNLFSYETMAKAIEIFFTDVNKVKYIDQNILAFNEGFKEHYSN